MNEELKLTMSTLINLYRETATASNRTVDCGLFVKSQHDFTSWQVPPFHSATGNRAGTVLSVTRCRRSAEMESLTANVGSSSGHRRIVLGLGSDEIGGQVVSLVQSPDYAPCFLPLNIVGASDLKLSTWSPARGSAETMARFSIPDAELMDLWAPTRLAAGEKCWQALSTLDITIIGAGRTGSMIAESLHRTGARITIVDDDHFDPHNIGESSLVNLTDVGVAKVHAVARHLKDTSPNPRSVNCVATSVESLSSLSAVRNCSLLITAVDNPAARLISGILASMYLVPLLDLGTGISFGENFSGIRDAENRTMGADIRLCMPDRCLLCSGGLPGLHDAIHHLLEPPQPAAVVKRVPWFRQRSGSLRSLNGCAVNLGVRMLEDWLDGRLPARCNRLLQLRFEPDGKPGITTVDFSHGSTTSCPLCSMAGKADQGLLEIRSLLERLQTADVPKTNR